MHIIAPKSASPPPRSCRAAEERAATDRGHRCCGVAASALAASARPSCRFSVRERSAAGLEPLKPESMSHPSARSARARSFAGIGAPGLKASMRLCSTDEATAGARAALRGSAPSRVGVGSAWPSQNSGHIALLAAQAGQAYPPTNRSSPRAPLHERRAATTTPPFCGTSARRQTARSTRTSRSSRSAQTRSPACWRSTTEVLRSRRWSLRAGRARLFASEGQAARDDPSGTFALSKPVDSLSFFLSHSWRTSRVAKYCALCVSTSTSSVRPSRARSPTSSSSCGSSSVTSQDRCRARAPPCIPPTTR